MLDKRAKNAHMKAERATAELHRGGHVMIRLNNGEAALFRGAEFADIDDIRELSRLAGLWATSCAHSKQSEKVWDVTFGQIGQPQQLPLRTINLTNMFRINFWSRASPTMMTLTSSPNGPAL